MLKAQKMTRVIIAGSRNFADEEFVHNTISDLTWHIPSEDLEIVSGGCRGVDKFAEDYAEQWDLISTVFNADWDKYGKAAGPIRNEQMARYASESNHGMLIAFPVGESRGTRNMIKLAKQYGLEVHEIKHNEKI